MSRAKFTVEGCELNVCVRVCVCVEVLRSWYYVFIEDRFKSETASCDLLIRCYIECFISCLFPCTMIQGKKNPLAFRLGIPMFRNTYSFQLKSLDIT